MTGATGFIGRHVLRHLVDSGYHVRALVRPGSQLDAPEGSVDEIVGDVRQAGHLVDTLRGCRYLIHVAAMYSFSPRDRKAIWNTNVLGTASILEAARIAGVERAVVTSSSATVGSGRSNAPATERDWAVTDGRERNYHASKIQQERVAWAAQIPTVLLLPSAPVGPGDSKPTPTGKMIVDFMRGRIFASLPGGLNLVPVEDVARAHVTALAIGEPNKRYILGGENLYLTEIWDVLASICGRSAPKLRLPYSLAMGLGLMDEVRCRLSRAQPLVPIEGVHMARRLMFVSSRRAGEELDFHPGSAREALTRAVTWFGDNGYA